MKEDEIEDLEAALKEAEAELSAVSREIAEDERFGGASAARPRKAELAARIEALTLRLLPLKVERAGRELEGAQGRLKKAWRLAVEARERAEAARAEAERLEAERLNAQGAVGAWNEDLRRLRAALDAARRKTRAA